MLLGIDIGFGFSKTITRLGEDVFPSVVGDWTAAEFQIDSFDRTDLDAVGYEARRYLVGERALKLASRLFVGLSRELSPRARRVPPKGIDQLLRLAVEILVTTADDRGNRQYRLM